MLLSIISYMCVYCVRLCDNWHHRNKWMKKKPILQPNKITIDNVSTCLEVLHFSQLFWLPLDDLIEFNAKSIFFFLRKIQKLQMLNELTLSVFETVFRCLFVFLFSWSNVKRARWRRFAIQTGNNFLWEMWDDWIQFVQFIQIIVKRETRRKRRRIEICRKSSLFCGVDCSTIALFWFASFASLRSFVRFLLFVCIVKTTTDHYVLFFIFSEWETRRFISLDGEEKNTSSAYCTSDAVKTLQNRISLSRRSLFVCAHCTLFNYIVNLLCSIMRIFILRNFSSLTKSWVVIKHPTVANFNGWAINFMFFSSPFAFARYPLKLNSVFVFS